MTALIPMKGLGIGLLWCNVDDDDDDDDDDDVMMIGGCKLLR